MTDIFLACACIFVYIAAAIILVMSAKKSPEPQLFNTEAVKAALGESDKPKFFNISPEAYLAAFDAEIHGSPKRRGPRTVVNILYSCEGCEFFRDVVRGDDEGGDYTGCHHPKVVEEHKVPQRMFGIETLENCCPYLKKTASGQTIVNHEVPE